MNRYLLQTLLLSCFLMCAGCFMHLQERKVSKRSAEIHKKVLILDSHTDTPYLMQQPGFNIRLRHDARKHEGHVDLPRMAEGRLDAVFFAVFLWQEERTPEGNAKAKSDAMQLFDTIFTTIKRYPDVIELASTPDDAYRIEKSGKHAIYIGIENGWAIGMDISLVKTYYDMGARYITLCHVRNNDICDSSNDTIAEHNGLSEFGRQVVTEMNRLGMMVDVSHISDKSFYDVMEVTKAPVIASHSCSRTICNHPRNLTDDMLKKLAENGGVIQMCILSDYVKTPAPCPTRDSLLTILRKKYYNYKDLPPAGKQKAEQEWGDVLSKYPYTYATVSDVVDHIDYMVKLIGIDHVGIGTDFDGGGGVEDCFDVSQMGNITRELVRRGYTEQDIEKIWSGNFMRVFREVERIAKTL